MSGGHLELLGEAASLGAAFLWAISVALFRPAIQVHGARTVNLLKCLIASVLLVITVLLLGQTRVLLDASGADLGWLAASGVVGLTIGDTALFAAVSRIGTHRALLMQTFAPVFAALLAFAWLGERLGPLELTGAALVLAGVALVVASGRRVAVGLTGASTSTVGLTNVPTGADSVVVPAAVTIAAPDAADPGRPDPGHHGPVLVGLALGVLGALGQGAGVVIAKQGMDTVTAIPAALLRLSVGALGLAAVGLVTGTLFAAGRALMHRATLRRVLPASFLGTYLAMMLMMTGIAFAPASIAAVLLALPPVFSLAVEGIAGRERVTPRKIAGTLLAVAGVAVLVWR